MIQFKKPYGSKNTWDFFSRIFGLLFRFWFGFVAPKFWIDFTLCLSHVDKIMPVMIPIVIKNINLLGRDNNIKLGQTIYRVLYQVGSIRQRGVFRQRRITIFVENLNLQRRPPHSTSGYASLTTLWVIRYLLPRSLSLQRQTISASSG